MSFENMILTAKGTFDKCVKSLQADYKDDPSVTIITDSRTIIHDGQYMYLLLHNVNSIAYMDYSDDLFRFLANKHLCSYKVNKRNRIQIELSQYNLVGERYSPLFSRFCYYYYNMGYPAQQLANEFKAISEHNRGYEVDHVNSNTYINTRWNLVSLPSEEHWKKGTLAERIKPPYFMYPYAMEDGSYRVIYGYAVPSGHDLIGWKDVIKCPNNDALCNFMKAFLCLEAIPEKVTKFGTPKELYVRNKKGIYAANDFETSAKIWEEISALDDSTLKVWSVAN